MRTAATVLLAASLLIPAACSRGSGPGEAVPPGAVTSGTLARIYYWRAKPGKFDEYTRYIREHAEPIDAAAQRQGAFVSVTTYMTRDPSSPWTHMRVFILRDSAQLRSLSAALTAAGNLLEPDSLRRRETSRYSAGLRDAAGSATVDILR